MTKRNRPGERGQASIEFVSIAPLVFILYMLMLMVAMIWHGHHLNSQLSLEAASGAGISTGYGASRVSSVVSGWGSGFFIDVSGYERFEPDGFMQGEGLVVGLRGVEPQYTLFGVQNTGTMQARTASPVWEFAP